MLRRLSVLAALLAGCQGSAPAEPPEVGVDALMDNAVAESAIDVVQQGAGQVVWVRPRGRGPSPNARRGMFKIWLRPPMTMIFDLTRDP